MSAFVDELFSLKANKNPLTKVKGQYDQAVGLLFGLVFGLECLRSSVGLDLLDIRILNGLQWIPGLSVFKGLKKKLTDIGFFVPIAIGMVFL